MSEDSFRQIGLPTMIRRIKMVSIGIACVVFASLSAVADADNATGKTQFRGVGDALSNAEIHSLVVYIRGFRATK